MSSVYGLLERLYLGSIPTILFVVILLLILDRLFFHPVARVMEKRAEETDGALARAREQAAQAEKLAGEYARAIQAARLEIYGARQEDHQRALAERERMLEQARQRGDKLIQEAQAALAAEADAAKTQLTAVSHSLAREITWRILGMEPPPAEDGNVRA